MKLISSDSHKIAYNVQIDIITFLKTKRPDLKYKNICGGYVSSKKCLRISRLEIWNKNKDVLIQLDLPKSNIWVWITDIPVIIPLSHPSAYDVVLEYINGIL